MGDNDSVALWTVDALEATLQEVSVEARWVCILSKAFSLHR